MLRVFYALGDTRTPALISAGVSAITITTVLTAARLIPGPRLLIAIALATAIAYSAGLLLVAVLLRSRLGHVDGRRLLNAHARMLAAAVAAGLAAALTVRAAQPIMGTAWYGSAATILLAATAGAALYALSARVLRITEFGELTAVIRAGSA